MDYMYWLEMGLVVVGAASVLALGIEGALALMAPKTKTTADDAALGFMHKVVGALKWVKGLLDGVALNLKK